MKRITAAVLLVLLALGWLGLPPWPPAGDTELQPWLLYTSTLNLSGYLAIGLLSLAMVLALRLPLLDRRLGGLDQAYRLHRVLAQWGLALGLLHYGLRLTVKQLRQMAWMHKPEGLPSQTLELLRPFHGSAKTLAEWALYGLLLLVLLALWRRLPYRWFARSHRLMPLAYVLLVYHSLVFLPASYWQGMGWLPAGVLLLLMGAGVLAALWSLFGRVGRRRRVSGEVLEVSVLPLDVLALRLRLAPGWPGHQSGQFGLATFDSREGAHPFTIASHWAGDGELRFAIKGLGDYTRRLPQLLAPGDPVWVEGPYGRFVFDDDKPVQIWVGGGIGMTPFLARLEELAHARATDRASAQRVHLFYCTRRQDPLISQRIQALAHAAGVHLRVQESSHDGPLTAAALMAQVPDWAQASLWFCGPARFGQALRAELMAAGLAAADFHQEAFEFR